jgi:hypothetical protein
LIKTRGNLLTDELVHNCVDRALRRPNVSRPNVHLTQRRGAFGMTANMNPFLFVQDVVSGETREECFFYLIIFGSSFSGRTYKTFFRRNLQFW